MSKSRTVLEAMKSGAVMNYEQIGEASGVNRKQLTTYMRRLEESGFVEHKGHTRPPGNRQVVAFFQVTDEGLEHIGVKARAPIERPKIIDGESVVARAIRTQPNSVFAMGAAA